MIVWKDDLLEKLWRSLNLSNVIFKGEWYSSFSWWRPVVSWWCERLRDGNCTTAGSSCQCIQASSEFLPKVDTSDIADQQQLDLQPFDQVLLTSIVESCWHLWRNYGHLIERLGTCVLNQLNKDVSIFFELLTHHTRKVPLTIMSLKTWVCLHWISRCCAIARNSEEIWTYSSSSRLPTLVPIESTLCNFLLVINCNVWLISCRLRDSEV